MASNVVVLIDTVVSISRSSVWVLVSRMLLLKMFHVSSEYGIWLWQFLVQSSVSFFGICCHWLIALSYRPYLPASLDDHCFLIFFLTRCQIMWSLFQEFLSYFSLRHNTWEEVKRERAYFGFVVWGHRPSWQRKHGSVNMKHLPRCVCSQARHRTDTAFFLSVWSRALVYAMAPHPTQPPVNSS